MFDINKFFERILEDDSWKGTKFEILYSSSCSQYHIVKVDEGPGSRDYRFWGIDLSGWDYAFSGSHVLINDCVVQHMEGLLLSDVDRAKMMQTLQSRIQSSVSDARYKMERLQKKLDRQTNSDLFKSLHEI